MTFLKQLNIDTSLKKTQPNHDDIINLLDPGNDKKQCDWRAQGRVLPGRGEFCFN